MVYGEIACGRIHPGRVEPASPRESHGDVSWVVSTPRSPVPVSMYLLALQLKPSLSGLRAPGRPLFTHPPFWFESRWRKEDAKDRSLIGRGVLTLPPFVGPFCSSVGDQSTAQSWHADPLIRGDGGKICPKVSWKFRQRRNLEANFNTLTADGWGPAVLCKIDILSQGESIKKKPKYRKIVNENPTAVGKMTKAIGQLC